MGREEQRERGMRSERSTEREKERGRERERQCERSRKMQRDRGRMRETKTRKNVSEQLLSDDRMLPRQRRVDESEGERHEVAHVGQDAAARSSQHLHSKGEKVRGRGAGGKTERRGGG
jgi:hypothetical protein